MNKRVMLVDDDEEDCYIFTQVAQQVDKELEIICVTSGAELLEQLKRKDPPDYIFLDLNMPGMHGLECLRQLTNKNALRNTPVIVYSTSSNPKHIKEAFDEGASNYIIKSPSITTLKERFKEIFSSEA
jgi:CheY-like chemotaxis protein